METIYSAKSYTEMVIYTILEGDVTEVKRLVAMESSLNTMVGNTLWLPIHVCAQYGKSKELQILLEQGVDVNIKCRSKRRSPALLYAAAEEHVECVRILMEQPEVDINCEDTNGFKLLDLLVSWCRDMDIYMELLIRGLDLTNCIVDLDISIRIPVKDKEFESVLCTILVQAGAYSLQRYRKENAEYRLLKEPKRLEETMVHTVRRQLLEGSHSNLLRLTQDLAIPVGIKKLLTEGLIQSG